MPPPNVKIRSRMMSALNGGGLIILNKNKKHTSKTVKHKQVNSVLAAGLTEQPITAAPQMTTESSLTTVQLPIMADYAIKPLLQTNFIDSKGRVLQNVVSIPIRVSESIKKKSPKPVVTQVEVDPVENRQVTVKFGPSSDRSII